MADARLAKFVAYIKGEQFEGAMHVAAIYGPLRQGGVSIEVVGGVTWHTKRSAVTRDHYLVVAAEQTRKEFARWQEDRSAGFRRSDRQSDQARRDRRLP